MNESKTVPILLDDERLDEVNEQIRLIQKKQGLTFGTDAYLLAAFIRPQPRARAVELGSGTGIIPLLLCAKNKIRSAVAVEIQPSFAELIERNAALNGFSDRILTLCADVRTLTSAQIGSEVELVFSNPPYLRTDAGKSNAAIEKEIARHEVHGSIYDFCSAASSLLRTKGRFVCVYRAERAVDLLDAMRRNRLEPKRLVFIHADPLSPPSTVLVEAVKDASPSLSVLPPLFLYGALANGQQTRPLSEQAAEIYRTCAFPDTNKLK